MTASPTPSGWPPDPEESGTFTAPLFPLPDVFLFPGQVLRLQIFEPRYLRMMTDILDASGRIVVAPIVNGSTGDATPEVPGLAGLGEVARFERLANGNYLIWLLGLNRVRIEEIECHTPYRQVRAEHFEEIAPNPGEAENLCADLRDAILERARSAAEKLADETDVRILTDVLGQLLGLPTDEMCALYAEPEIATRARQTLAAHRRSEP